MKRRRKILYGSFALSLFFHVAALLFWHRYSLWFSSPQKGEPHLFAQIEKKERDQILKTAFASHNSDKPSLKPAQPEQEAPPTLALRSPIQIHDQELLVHSHLAYPFPPHELLASSFVPTFSVPYDPINLLEHLPKDLLLPTAVTPSAAHLPLPQPAKTEVTLEARPPTTLPEAATPLITYSDTVESPLTESPQCTKTLPSIPLPALPHLPSLADLETASYSDSFEAELVFVPREEEKGYLFALTLIPRPDLKLSKIRQHFTFLIDRSNSIQQERLTATRSAIQKALNELSADDTFNIIAFDSKTEKMAPASLPCTPKSLSLAEKFLDQMQLGSFFSSSDLYRPLVLTVPGRIEGDEIHTAILLTDGETLGKKQALRSLLHDWTQYNNGKVSLFVVGMGGDPHLATLDAATFCNKGKVSTASTTRGLKRKLLKLVKTIHTPVAKNLSCKAISRSPQGHIQLFPQSAQAPHLYLDQPYVIIGETDSLDDFVLFVQGRLKDRWLNIKKHISFVQAKKGSKSLRKEWALQRAYALYEQYARDENPQHLVQAEALLEPFDLAPIR